MEEETGIILPKTCLEVGLRKHENHHGFAQKIKLG